ncbi:MAG TPA: hypothetical protein DDW18_02665 [Firmicutes bacterium]|nr:hypothetical protein [Bacillota bacterium]
MTKLSIIGILAFPKKGKKTNGNKTFKIFWMKKRLFLLIPSLLALSSCQKEEKETTYKEALSML